MSRLQTSIDRLIPPELLQFQQLDLLFRARALVGGVLLIGALALSMLILVAWQIGDDRTFLTMMLLSVALALLTGAVSLFLFRYYATFALSTHLFTTMHTAVQLWIILATGGVRESPMVS
ncbi:MAG: hypothetical protein ABW049_07155, partial [Spongiibacteraceae bacterium]